MSVDTQAAGLAQLLLQREVEAFYTNEVELLDDRRFTEWLDLFADDARYWMPIARNVAFDRPEHEYTRERADANWFDEGKDDLTKRVQQIVGGDHWAEEPRSRTIHAVTNVNIVKAGEGELTVHSRIIVSQHRQDDDINHFVGKRIDLLRRGATLQVAHRTIYLNQSVLLAKGLTTFF
ncbi:MAG TPA: 3-phenylpropionate/cinnamic acid dioxygenase subunit beta [Candidatus Lustribacter sp.]|jgi:3-phenylpropionate/cinnamic acid dioxygenase small subunit|nr:3-phenylpropionate/cinnamic acid dioxygenase subunit beta [Candidatus Lustribacter sp.]